LRGLLPILGLTQVDTTLLCLKGVQAKLSAVCHPGSQVGPIGSYGVGTPHHSQVVEKRLKPFFDTGLLYLRRYLN